jgi:transposase
MESQQRSIAMSKRAKKHQKVNRNMLIVAIDVGKDTHHGYCCGWNSYATKVFSFSNNREGFDTLWDMIFRANEKVKAREILVGFESTGSYELPLVHYLSGKPVILRQVNPMHSKKIKELPDNSPLKHDRKDPRVIASILQLGHSLSVIIPRGSAARLRRLIHARERLVGDRTVMLNRLQQLVHQIFPEYLGIMHGVESKSSRYLLRHYPTPKALVNLGQARLTRLMEKVSRKQLGAQRAWELMAAAAQSVGITEGIDIIVWEIHYDLSEVERRDRIIAALEKEMEAILETTPHSRPMLSIPGIGTITVAGFLGEVGDISQLRTPDALIKLAGLNLFEVSSGRRKGGIHISKRGRSLLRKLMHMASINLIKKGGIFHDYYTRLLDRGKVRKQALVAVSRKLLRLLFALTRDNTVYDRAYTLKRVA